MTISLVTSPIAAKSQLSAAPAIPSQSDQSSQWVASVRGLQGDDPFALPGDNFSYTPNPDLAPKPKQRLDPEAKATTPQDAPELNTAGESVPDATDATSILLARERLNESEAAQDSLLLSYWPYAMVVVALVGWVIIQYRKKPAPSFKHHTIPEKSAEPGTKGQFKVSQRFQKKESEPEKSKTESSSLASKTAPITEPKSSIEVRHADDGRPADDEFEIAVSEGDAISDSDVIGHKDAAEIVKDVDSRIDAGHPQVFRPRFKTETKKSNAVPKD